MIYYEFSELVVERGLVPSAVCCSELNKFELMRNADIAFFLEEPNRVCFIKNRRGFVGIAEISEADKIMLKLQAVLVK